MSNRNTMAAELLMLINPVFPYTTLSDATMALLPLLIKPFIQAAPIHVPDEPGSSHTKSVSQLALLEYWLSRGKHGDPAVDYFSTVSVVVAHAESILGEEGEQMRKECGLSNDDATELMKTHFTDQMTHGFGPVGYDVRLSNPDRQFYLYVRPESLTVAVRTDPGKIGVEGPFRQFVLEQYNASTPGRIELTAEKPHVSEKTVMVTVTVPGRSSIEGSDTRHNEKEPTMQNNYTEVNKLLRVLNPNLPCYVVTEATVSLIPFLSQPFYERLALSKPKEQATHEQTAVEFLRSLAELKQRMVVIGAFTGFYHCLTYLPVVVTQVEQFLCPDAAHSRNQDCGLSEADAKELMQQLFSHFERVSSDGMHYMITPHGGLSPSYELCVGTGSSVMARSGDALVFVEMSIIDFVRSLCGVSVRATTQGQLTNADPSIQVMNGVQTPQPEEVVVTKSMTNEAYAATQPTVDSSIQASTMAAIEVAALKAETDEETPLNNSANFEVVGAKDAKGDLVYLLRLLKHHGDDSKWVVCATDADLKDVISRRRQL